MDGIHFDQFMVKVARALTNSIDEGKRCTGVKFSFKLLKLLDAENDDLKNQIMNYIESAISDQCSEVKVALLEGLGQVAYKHQLEAINEKSFSLAKSLINDNRMALSQQAVDTLIDMLQSEGMSSKKEQILHLYVDVMTDQRHTQAANYAFIKLDQLLEALKYDKVIDNRILDVYVDKIQSNVDLSTPSKEKR